MNFIGILLALSIIIALFGCYGATKNAKSAKEFKTQIRRPFTRPHLHFVERKQFADLYESEPHHLLFRLESFRGSRKNREGTPPRVGISLRELEKCIPWIPGDSRVFICSPDGFGPALLKQLEGLHTQRDLFLVDNLSGTSHRQDSAPTANRFSMSA
jgi:hypothetical protein